MNILIIGNGAREHTLAWKISQSTKTDKLFVAPGNAGTSALAQNLPISAEDVPALTKAAQENKIDLVMVGPEVPLTKGIVDALTEIGIPTFGPQKGAAQIEGSKVFAKELMFKYGIPCARSATFTSFEEALNYVKQQPIPMVIKADGLAAGKGVIIATSQEQAIQALSDIMQKKAFGEAGDKVLVEECLVGREASLLAFTDGKTLSPMVPACDYKRALDGDQGLNTGGMGCYSPSEFFTPELREQVMGTVMKPTIEAMAKEGYPFKGILYAGLMMTADGPKVLEFNARFGDPETQVILPLLKTDIVDIMQAVIDDNLSQINIEWSDDACVGVVLAADEYPESYQKGFPISGLSDVDEDALVFHAGTDSDTNGQVITSGGRVLTVVGKGQDYSSAREKVYQNISRINFEGCRYRTDIAIIKSQS
ncbi:MAG: phosphoribosylamine--glycine ligase [Chloroflexi bacterium]|jgi:phosphoribosylamine---glycine ligase|nr:phosphoribosylamine--glycine ligase [Chloroflexota bacterium]